MIKNKILRKITSNKINKLDRPRIKRIIKNQASFRKLLFQLIKTYKII